MVIVKNVTILPYLSNQRYVVSLQTLAALNHLIRHTQLSKPRPGKVIKCSIRFNTESSPHGINSRQANMILVLLIRFK